MPEWLAPVLTCLGIVITAAVAFYAHARKKDNDLVDQLQEERNHMDAKYTESENKRLESEAKRISDNAATNARIDTLSNSLNAALATISVKDLHILILTNHIHVQAARIDKIDPPADPFPILPQLPPTIHIPTA